MTISALEHRIPELFFTNEEHPGEAVSAVKALAVASAEGQRIYQITSANVGVVNSLNIGQEVKDEIIASVAVGKEATVSQSSITVAGWTGVGYIITDPETGAGAYRISGGGNGGLLVAGAGLSAVGILGLFSIGIGGSLIVTPFIGLWVIPIIISIGLTIVAHELFTDTDGKKWKDARGRVIAIVAMTLAPMLAAWTGTAPIGGVGGGSLKEFFAYIIGIVLTVLGSI